MQQFIRSLKITALAANLVFVSYLSAAQHIKVPRTQEEWTRDYRPFRIAGNLYYVGTYDLACYLITTPKGHILINTGLQESATMIRKHVEALGFRFSDIKILLATHVHYDHVGAMASIKKMTGAKMMINSKDAPALADGGNSDYAMGGKGLLFQPVKADVLLHDRDSVNIGGKQIIALHHPGHTKGATSFLFDVADENRSYRVLIANMPSVIVPRLSKVKGYPDIVADYAYTLDDLRKQKFDIWLSSHASQFGLHDKHGPGDGYHPEVFMDREGYDAAIDDLQKQYLENISSN
jgi:metallo-beta-lactamase class B